MVDGETVEEKLTKVGSHAADDHDITVTPVMADQVRTRIKSN